MKPGLHCFAVLVVGMACYTGCPPPAPIVPDDAAGDAQAPPAPTGDAEGPMLAGCPGFCANMALLGCSGEAALRDGGDECTALCERVRSEHLAPLDIDCAIRAHSREQARSCAGVRCR